MQRAAHSCRRWSIRSISIRDDVFGRPGQVEQAIDKGQVKAGVIIPPHFAASVDQDSANFLMLLDGSDQFAVRSGYSAVGLVAQSFGLQISAASVAFSRSECRHLRQDPVCR